VRSDRPTPERTLGTRRATGGTRLGPPPPPLGVPLLLLGVPLLLPGVPPLLLQPLATQRTRPHTWAQRATKTRPSSLKGTEVCET